MDLCKIRIDELALNSKHEVIKFVGTPEEFRTTRRRVYRRRMTMLSGGGQWVRSSCTKLIRHARRSQANRATQLASKDEGSDERLSICTSIQLSSSCRLNITTRARLTQLSLCRTRHTTRRPRQHPRTQSTCLLPLTCADERLNEHCDHVALSRPNQAHVEADSSCNRSRISLNKFVTCSR